MIFGKRKEQKGRFSVVAISNIDIDIPETRKNVAVLRKSEIVHGGILGDGSFSNVFDLSRLKLRRFPIMKKEKRKTRHALRDALREGEIQFAIKTLKASLKRGKKEKIKRAICGLIRESEILAKLSHENIVDIHGVSEDISNYHSDSNYDDYFIVMEKVENTMDRVIWDWKFLGGQANHFRTMIVVKIKYALQIARALEYMHERRIIYRDLKPKNIGLKGHTIKLFDFGLTRLLPKKRGGSSSLDDDCYLMSCAGTPKYMAPEIFISRKYNLKADVYSWSIVIYEMLTLIKPYEQCDQQELQVAFVRNLGERPDIGPHIGLPYAVDDLLVRAWDHIIENRPTMSHVCEELEYMLQDTSFHANTFGKGKGECVCFENKSNNNLPSYVSWNASAPTRANVCFPAAA